LLINSKVDRKPQMPAALLLQLRLLFEASLHSSGVRGRVI
jgi:hypothetical protein